MRPLSKDGNILTIADRLIMVTEWFHNEITYWYRVIAGGGTVANRGLVEDLYKLWEQHGRLDNIRVSWVHGAGSVQRTSGIYRFFSRLFNLSLEGIKYTATQLVTNGNFANGTTGWTPRDSTLSVANKILSVTGTGTNAIVAVYREGLSVTSGDKVYAKAKVRVTNSLNPQLQLLLQGQITGTAAFQTQSTTTQNTWYELSGLVAPVFTGLLRFRINSTYSSAANATNSVMEVDGNYGCFAINLTATFGAGNEPSKGVCDLLFADYFDGTKEVQLNDVTQTTANSQPYFVNGAMVNPNGATRFMTHPTVSFGAGEAWSVSFILNWYGDPVAESTWFAGKKNDANNILGLQNSKNFSWNRTNATFNLFTVLSGKRYVVSFVADNGLMKLYVNGTFIQEKSMVTSFIFDSIIHSYVAFRGSMSLFAIQSGNPTPTQILEEYNLLRSYIPEIATTLIGTDEIATENCQMVATPMGRVINLNNTAASVNFIPNGNFATNDLSFWTNRTRCTMAWNAGGYAEVVSTGTGDFAIGGIGTFQNMFHKITFRAKSINSTQRPRIITAHYSSILAVKQPGLTTSWQDYEFWGFTSGINGITLYLVEALAVVGTQVDIDDIQSVPMGFSGANQVYTAYYDNTSGTVAQKTSAAILAAAMWRSPDSDHDKQAVFSKIYNDYAAALMRFDIAAYNTANPSTPWDYHVMTRAEEQALAALDADTLKSNSLWTSTNGTNETGLGLLGSGVINADGTYSNFGTKTRLMTGEGYALDVNDDGTSAEIAVTTEGGILRLVKD